MSVSALEKLMFTVGVKDLTSKPVSKITSGISRMSKVASSGFDNIRNGAVGLVGAGYAIKTFMEPVYEMERALGEVKSLGVADTALQKLKRSSLAFSIQYGESATDFVRSSYDIQSAIGGLTDNELSQFTLASNVLAKGTKADAATITNYMGTMYGIFQNQANAMGKAKWVNQLTGQTAQAVEMFKTTGAEMSAAFTSVGANATASGVALHEQMAVLGTLQATMSGSEAGTKYRAFLNGVAKAQGELGLQFTDSHGRMLPIIEILDKLKRTYGDNLTEMQSLELKQAFGSDEAVSMIKLLMANTKSLGSSINKLGDVNGMEKAADMAYAMIDPWDQFSASTEAVRIAFGSSLLPTVNKVLKVLSNGLNTIGFWSEEFPHLSRVIGITSITILALAGVLGTLTMVVGFTKLAFATLGFTTLATTVAGWGMWTMLRWTNIQAVLVTASTYLLNGAMWLLGKGFQFAAFGMRILNIALRLNPIGLIITSVVLLAAVLGHVFGVWGKLASAFADTSWGKALIGWFDNLMGKLKKVASWLGFEFESAATIEQTVGVTSTSPVANVEDDFQSRGRSMTENSQSVPSLSHTDFKNATGSMNTNFNDILNSPQPMFGDVHITAEGGMTPEDLETWGMMQGG